MLWGGWFFTVAAYLSIAEGGHRYYTVMLAPAVAALAGIGVAALWRDYRAPGRRGWLLPVALVGVAAVQARVLFDYPLWRVWLLPVVTLALVGALFLAFLRLRRFAAARTYAVGAASIGVLALFVAPALWSGYTVWHGTSGFLPSAGPRTATGPPGGGGPGENEARELVKYLLANQEEAEYLVAVSGAMSAAPIILNTDEPVVSLGGYNGVDPVFTPEELGDLVDSGVVRFFLMPDRASIEEMRAERQAAGNVPIPGSGLPQNGLRATA